MGHKLGVGTQLHLIFRAKNGPKNQLVKKPQTLRAYVAPQDPRDAQDGVSLGEFQRRPRIRSGPGVMP